MKTPPKKSAKPKAKPGRAAGSPRSAGRSSLGARTAGRGAKDEAALVDFETQGRADIRLPADAHVVGEPVTVTALRNSGLPSVGLLATCQRGGNRYEIGLADISFAAESSAAKPILSRGKRPMFEMEEVRPGADPEDFDSDPIVEAAERSSAGDNKGAYDLLMNLLAKDLRCLDAHAHLGNLEFDRNPQQALRHHEMGTTIGGASLGEAFDGVLPWSLLDNRPFLRCLHGVGICAWRLGDMRTAKTVFAKMLWLNPNDNQGARFNLAALAAGHTWEEMQDDQE